MGLVADCSYGQLQSYFNMKIYIAFVGLAFIVSLIPQPIQVTELNNKEFIDIKHEKLSKTIPNEQKLARRKDTHVDNKNVSKTVKLSSSGELARWLIELRTCEAGGNYKTNTGNGFYGAYQFMISTWNRIAPKAGRPDLVGVRPDKASPADQDFMIIQNTKLSAGGLATQNPGCYKKLGLSKFPPN